MRPLQNLHEELSATHHIGRLERMLELGQKAAAGDHDALATIDALTEGDVYARRLALTALHRLRDGKRLLRFMEDQAQSLRSMAFTMAPRICDDAQALEALKIAYTLRRERALLRALALRRRRPVVDRYLDWLAEQPGQHDFADIVPWASSDGVRRHLERALARPSQIFWTRLARSAPAALGAVLVDRLRAVTGEPDAVTRQLIDAHTRTIAAGAPDEALELLDVLCARGINSEWRALQLVGRRRPEATWELIDRHDLPVRFPMFGHGVSQLSPKALHDAVWRHPILLGDAKSLLEQLSPEQIDAVVKAWCDVAEEHPMWGFPLLPRIKDAARLEEAYQRWTVAARDRDGVIRPDALVDLPPALREREARRHLHEVVALGTRPNERILYAKFLPWEAAEAELKAFIGFPDGAVRGLALLTMLAIPGLRPDEPALVERGLKLVTQRKHEQDPVRQIMLQALVAWPQTIWRKEHVPTVHQILRDALDAGDLSRGTAAQAEALMLRTFRLDPAAGAKWIGTFIRERGNLNDVRLGAHLSDEEVTIAAPHLFEVLKTWRAQERWYQILGLADSLGERMRLVPGLGEMLVEIEKAAPWGYVAMSAMQTLRRHDRARYESVIGAVVRRWVDRGWLGEILAFAAHNERKGKRKQPPLHQELVLALEKIARGLGTDGQVIQALTLLRVRALHHFDTILADLLRRDASYVCVPVVHWHLHERRQDLLGPFLGETVISGRFATGKTAWLLPYKRGFYRWTPAQNTTFTRSLAKIVGDHQRDTPTIWSCLAVLAAIDSAPLDALAAAADDDRPAIQERAIRVMGRCDQGQCVPTLIGCLDDKRSRFAIYGLRRALKDMLPRTALHLLGEVPMRKVTVAKEVLRLLGELRIEAAYQRLVGLDATDLHRDVRIALLRALWDHLDREPTWGVFTRAVEGSDWVMASRLGDIPADRLTKESDRRLSGLLSLVLQRPEPEARIDLLRRAARLAVSDPERRFLRACAEQMTSVHDDEVQAAALALLYRADERDMSRLPELLGRALADPRCLHVGVTALLSVPIRSRAVWIAAAEAAEAVLAADPRWLVLRIRCAAAARTSAALGDYLTKLGQAGAPSPDAVTACREAVEAQPFEALAELTEKLLESTCPEIRRVGLWALVRDAGPGRGWSPERLARLARLQGDPVPALAGAALAVFPPREMVQARAKPQAKPK